MQKVTVATAQRRHQGARHWIEPNAIIGHRPLASLAVLADEHPDWRPDHHRQMLWGCEASLQFPTVKLLDYRNRQAQLETEVNPFAVLTLSHLKAQETRHDPAQRYAWKLPLIKSLYRRGYERQDILELFRFIDWLLELPEGLEEQLWDELEAYERGEVMPYVTSVERIGIKKGILMGEEKGIPQGEAAILRRLLSRRFGPLRIPVGAIHELPLQVDRILDADSLDSAFHKL